MPAPPPLEPSTRDRLISAMTDALRRRGLHGIGLTELLQAAAAPKGVLYHHFPGGKNELAVAAIDCVVERMTLGLEQLLATTPEPLDAMRVWIRGATERLQRTGFESGCPLATVALETTAEDRELRETLARAFARLREAIAQGLQASGVEAPRAGALAALMVAAYEGGLLQARVAQSIEPMLQISDTLLALLPASPHSKEPLP